MTLLTRRSLLRGLFAAPAVVAVGNIMPVKLWKPIISVGPLEDITRYVGYEVIQLKDVIVLDRFTWDTYQESINIIGLTP